ncbi:HAD family hydrolase [Streptomyces desertarenae]|uniref:HAD family hydrolase n=1 Tax=Streptomyces desertarenae TaxID=2666184 RepID=A0ABW4PJ93_9ACTN
MADRLLPWLAGHDAVVFDLDGVLVDSNELKVVCMRTALADFDPELVEDFLHEFRRTFGRSRREHFAAFHREHLGGSGECSGFEDFFDRYAGAYAELLAERYRQVPLCAHADELVRALTSLGAELHVATGTLTAEAEGVLAARGLLDAFRSVRGGERPKAERLGEILARTGAAPQRTVLVGDSRQDLTAASAAGTGFLFVRRYAFFGASRTLGGSDAAGAHQVYDLDPAGAVLPASAPARDGETTPITVIDGKARQR